MSEYYYYGLAAMLYLATCWTFAVVRWFHTCRAPKERRAYIWPDRKLQVLVYAMSAVLIPYVVNPTDEAAWTLMKSYFPATYYFYSGLLMLCFAGTVKQWARWKSISWIAAVMVIATMLIPVLNAWLPIRFMSAEGLRFWLLVITAESIVMMGFCMLAMWQVWHWIREGRDANYSNPDDFPIDYASRILYFPLAMIPLVWPAFIFDSPTIMAVEHVLLAVFNMVLLLTVMPAWRRATIILAKEEDEDSPRFIDQQEASIEEHIDQTALEIEAYVRGEKAFLDCHLKIDDVVEHCQSGRTYVSLAFQRRFGSFANYVNGLRLAHYKQYAADHPEETKEAAAQASGFSSYNAYYRARQRYQGGLRPKE